MITGRKIYNSYCNYVHIWKNKLFMNTVWQHFVETFQLSKYNILCSITVLWSSREIYTGLKKEVFLVTGKQGLVLKSILNVRMTALNYTRFSVLGHIFDNAGSVHCSKARNSVIQPKQTNKQNPKISGQFPFYEHKRSGITITHK